MLIDSHCHLDAAELAPELDHHLRQARAKGVVAMIVPAVKPQTFSQVQAVAQRYPGVYYTLGIHPMVAHQYTERDLKQLSDTVARAMHDPRFVGLGEIGLDFFDKEKTTDQLKTHQETCFQVQLALARQYDLPVILHVRRAQDRVLKYLRQRPGLKGIAHAFNGSQQQAQAFIALGFCLGFGGAATFDRARQIRRLAQSIPLPHLVLETDAPYALPAWLGQGPNQPAELLGIAQTIAQLRQIPVAELSQQSNLNVLKCFHRINPMEIFDETLL
ncbi:TatD family hydrolase [Brackiella oedipodis]|uniref:TatD family hydrolase n=1 Tax=Brackiella oedipodis TaxID=124225 RepID=UPI00056E991C|nr:TatD family hydrolase [Brackiella oedipodis]